MDNQNEIKNSIIKLHLQGGLSQRKIGEQLGTSQSFVSTTVRAYNSGSFIYNPALAHKEPTDECEQIFAPSSDELPTVIETPNVSDDVIATDELHNTLDSECEQIIATTTSKQSISFSSPIAKNNDECEQTKVPSLLTKSKITFTNHGLWLNQFALQMLDNPTHLAYSFDTENVNLYIAPYDENNLLPFYTCSAKCSKNYTKTTNKPLINEIQEILEIEFKGNININLNRDAFKIQFNFKFENGQFIINIPSMISNINFETL